MPALERNQAATAEPQRRAAELAGKSRLIWAGLPASLFLLPDLRSEFQSQFTPPVGKVGGSLDVELHIGGLKGFSNQK